MILLKAKDTTGEVKLVEYRRAKLDINVGIHSGGHVFVEMGGLKQYYYGPNIPSPARFTNKDGIKLMQLVEAILVSELDSTGGDFVIDLHEVLKKATERAFKKDLI